MLGIAINRLRLEVVLGATEEERRVPQAVLADITLEVAADAACCSDALADTVDYRALADKVLAAVGGGREFCLVEALAAAIADTCLSADTRVKAVTVAVEKPSALVGIADSATVTLAKKRQANP